MRDETPSRVWHKHPTPAPAAEVGRRTNSVCIHHMVFAGGKPPGV